MREVREMRNSLKEQMGELQAHREELYTQVSATVDTLCEFGSRLEFVMEHLKKSVD